MAHRTEKISAWSMHDRRFSKVFTDPRFEEPPEIKNEAKKIKEDSRFSAMFTDPAFQTGYKMDKYGRKVTGKDAFNLHKYYDLDPDEATSNRAGYEAENEEEETSPTPKKGTVSLETRYLADKIKKAQAAEDFDENDKMWDHWDNAKKAAVEGDNKLTREERKILNRQTGQMFEYEADSSTSSESEFDYDKLTKEQVGEDTRAVLDDDTYTHSHVKVDNGKTTKRLAVVNCDWENIKAQDLYMIFRSFLSPEGSIVSVAIHPSEYGVKMMRKEATCGPDADIWDRNQLQPEVKELEAISNFIDERADLESGEEDNPKFEVEEEQEREVDEGDFLTEKQMKLNQEMLELEHLQDTMDKIQQGRAGEVLEKEVDTIYNKQALRKYELQKLRYYYAIAEFDTSRTADLLYQELNEQEYRSTCNVLRLSFVADDFEAPHDPTDVCSQIPERYKAASNKQTNALGSTYVALTWDQTDPNRVEAVERAFDDDKLGQMDIDAYLQDDDAITDAGFNTDYPVTEYETDTPDKKARNRYKEILNEFKALERTVRETDDETDAFSTDTEADDMFRINVIQNLAQHKAEKEGVNSSDGDDDNGNGNGDDMVIGVYKSTHRDRFGEDALEEVELNEDGTVKQMAEEEKEVFGPQSERKPDGFASWMEGTSNMGLKYLKKFGYKEGEGLGKNEDGCVDPVEVVHGDDGRGSMFRESELKAFRDRLEGKQKKALKRMKDVKLQIAAESDDSSGDGEDIDIIKQRLGLSKGDGDDKDGDDGVVGDKEDTFVLDDEVEKLDYWIEQQKQLKERGNAAVDEWNKLTNAQKRKRKREKEEAAMWEKEENAPLIADDIPEDARNDPFFQNVHDSTYMDADEYGPKTKKRRMEETESTERPKSLKELEMEEAMERERKIKARAQLEMLMASDNIKGSYDPEDTEVDPVALSKRLEKRLKTNWRLRRKIKKAVKKKLEEMDKFEFDAEDERFKAVTEDPAYSVDPTNKAFKSTPAMRQLMAVSRRARGNLWSSNKKRKKWIRADRSANKEKASAVNADALVESLKLKTAKIPMLKDGQRQRKWITQNIKNTRISRWRSRS